MRAAGSVAFTVTDGPSDPSGALGVLGLRGSEATCRTSIENRGDRLMDRMLRDTLAGRGPQPSVDRHGTICPNNPTR